MECTLKTEDDDCKISHLLPFTIHEQFISSDGITYLRIHRVLVRNKFYFLVDAKNVSTNTHKEFPFIVQDQTDIKESGDNDFENTKKCVVTTIKFTVVTNLSSVTVVVNTHKKGIYKGICALIMIKSCPNATYMIINANENYTLQIHLLVHSGEIPFKCQICNCKFLRKYSLQMHLRL